MVACLSTNPGMGATLYIGGESMALGGKQYVFNTFIFAILIILLNGQIRVPNEVFVVVHSL